VELYVHIFAAERTDGSTVRIWIPWQCTLTDLALLLPLGGFERGVHLVATCSACTFFTRYPGRPSFDRPHKGSVQISTLLGQKEAMALADSAPLSAVDEYNRLTILARVLPLQEVESDHDARLPRPSASDNTAEERRAQPGGSSALSPPATL